ncbi:cell division protein FtsA [Nitrosophilus alvini]|uniref:cell division protein FtsA n=1 Tax=Nitrosophilus alvini TaxID=2714855 RepID=UPI00190CBF72|nr:cell division protein FtsA [Nitrosophilus alvini]
MQNSVLAIDIGSTKICAIIAEKKENDELEIIGTGITKSQGLKKGTITNIDLASKSIKAALNDAKRVAGKNIQKAVVSISGAYTKSINSNGIVNIPNKEITIKEINRVMQTALYNANIPHEYEVLHVLPYNFKVDDQEFVEDPLGMNAGRLEVDVHIITTQKSNLYNLKKAVKNAGVEVGNVVLSGYASSIAVLNNDEKELGVAVIDMGGSTSNLVIHIGNSIIYNDFLGVGSNHITNDLSMALHTPLSVAEKIKIEQGSLKSSESGTIEIPVIGDENTTHEVSLEIVYNVIFARVEETLMILAKSIEKSGLKEQIGAGVVLTGGMTNMDGMRELAVAIFDNIPVRIARPRELEGMFDELKNPAFSTAIGLVLYGAGKFTPYEIDSNKKLRHKSENISKEEITSTNISKDESQKTDDTSEITEQLTNLENIKNESESVKEKASKFWRWITQLF